MPSQFYGSTFGIGQSGKAVLPMCQGNSSLWEKFGKHLDQDRGEITPEVIESRHGLIVVTKEMHGAIRHGQLQQEFSPYQDAFSTLPCKTY
jgi:hypothetical protein